MRHSVYILLCVARSATALATVLLLSACSNNGSVTVLLNSAQARDDVHVIFVPVDPAILKAAGGTRISSAQADTLARLQLLEDSAATLQKNFQQLRAELNSEAAALTKADRYSKEYARRYDEFRPRSLLAQKVRDARDHVRAQAAALRGRAAHLFPDSARIRARAIEARTRMEAASDGDRRARVIALAPGAPPTRARLAAGTWWVGVAQPGGTPAAFKKIDVARGARDSVPF